MKVDLDLAERVINRPHIIELRDNGWTVMHPPRCHPDLFACPVNQASTGMDDPGLRGQFACHLLPGDVLGIGERLEDAPGIDWVTLVTELRAAREVVKAARWIERTGALPPANEVGARRLSDLEQAVRAYDQAVAS